MTDRPGYHRLNAIARGGAAGEPQPGYAAMVAESDEAVQRAKRHGYGTLKVSARRWVVIVQQRAYASRTGGDKWRGFVEFKPLTRRVDQETAEGYLRTLDMAACKGPMELAAAKNMIRTGPHSP